MKTHLLKYLFSSVLALSFIAQPVFAGTKSNTVYEMRFSDGTETSAPGELVTYYVKITNKYSENTALTPGLSITAKNIEIPTVSDHGKRGTLANGKPGATVSWNYLNSNGSKNPYEVKIDTKKSHTFTFTIKTPSAFGSEYCVEAYVFPFLKDRDCNTVGKSAKKTALSKPVVKAVPTQPIKLSEKEFRVGGISSLNMDPDDQGVDWVVTDAVKKKYPNVKIELCPGNDFKNCIILDAVAENDGSQLINMPPVPRVGKWYLHIIGRNTSDGLVPSVSISKRIEVQ